MDYDVVADLAYGDGAEYMIENYYVTVEDIEDPVLRAAVIDAYEYVKEWRASARRVQQIAERIVEARQ